MNITSRRQAPGAGLLMYWMVFSTIALTSAGLTTGKRPTATTGFQLSPSTAPNGLSLADWPSGDGNCQVGIRLLSPRFFGWSAKSVPGISAKPPGMATSNDCPANVAYEERWYSRLRISKLALPTSSRNFGLTFQSL